MDQKLYQEIRQFLEKDKIPETVNNNKEEKKWRRLCTSYQVTEGILYRKAKWPHLTKVVKEGKTTPIIFLYHNDPLAGHLGATKTFHKLKVQYYWPQMYEEIKLYVQSCHQCQVHARVTKRNEVYPIPISAPWERVGIDFVGPLPETSQGNKYIITAIDYFTRWPEARAVQRADAQSAAKFIYKELICRQIGRAS